MSENMKDKIITAAVESLERPVIDRENVIEAFAHHVLEDCRDRDWPDETQAVIDGMSTAINECDEGDYEIVFDAVRDRVHAEFEKEAAGIVRRVIQEMAAEARRTQEVGAV
jgi:hypothetical protein